GFERGGEIDLAVHCTPGDRRDLWAKPYRLGKLVEHLVLDDRRFQIGDEKPFAPPGRRLNENIDLGAVDHDARGSLGRRRLRLVKEEIAGLCRGEPDRLAPNVQCLGNRRDEAWEARPAAEPGDQGEHHAHEPASYSRKRVGHKPAHARREREPRVLVVAGPTASGKSELALELADTFGGTIVNGDSLQVYRDLRVL